MVHAQQAEADSVRRGHQGHPRRKSHRRSPWACDECRLRKRKCDGSQPCQPCVASDLGLPHYPATNDYQLTDMQNAPINFVDRPLRRHRGYGC